jgi:hypothetical protein
LTLLVPALGRLMSFIFLGGSIKPPAIASSRSLACNAKLLYPDDDLNPALKESIL